MMASQVVTVVVWTLLVLSVAADDCTSLGCFCVNNVIECENIHLTYVPRFTFINTTDQVTMDLNTNDITVIPADVLPANLIILDVTDNPITTIEDTAFKACSASLQILVFSSALFKRIPDAFLHLTGLKTLSMESIIIHDWNEEAMKNIGKTITELDLVNVGIRSWPTWIQHFAQLSTLNLERNFISSLPDDALDQVSNTLRILFLDNNTLTAVPKALSKLKTLQSLYLNSNRIVDVSWLPQSSKLSLLWLNNNSITDAKLLSDSLKYCNNTLTDFDIQYNRLTAIPDLLYFTKLNQLDFSYNSISDPFSGSVPPKIYEMDLSHNFLSSIPRTMSTLSFVNYLVAPFNSIKEIHGTDFPPSATGVELGFNLISELTDTSFPQNSSIAVLHLNNNPIIKISSLALKNLLHLLELNLEGCKLTRLPLALATLPSLSMFDMTDSQNLVCTCMEKNLQSWVLKLSPQSVLGSCGQLGIYEFFSRLSPDCP